MNTQGRQYLAHLGAAVILGSVLTACSSMSALNALTPIDGYQRSSNIPFDTRTGLRLDVYSPANASQAPVVVFFYPGRWEKGSKDDYAFVGQSLASRGIVAVLPNYRLYPQVRFPVFVQDGARAVAWTRKHIEQYGGDPHKLFVMGHSAGAYIAAMLALDPEFLKGVGGSRAWLSGMIGLAGPYDFLPLTDPDLRDMFGPPEDFPRSQPIMYVDGNNPPLLLMHGKNDDIVKVGNTRKLAAAVVKAGGAVTTVIYPKMGHDRLLEALSAPLNGFSDVLAQVVDFVHQHSGQAAGAGSS